MFFAHHTLKVLPKEAVVVNVVRNETENRYKVIQVLTCPKHLWHDVTDPRTEVERLLLEKNKRHLQQIALEKGVSRRSPISDI